MACLANLAALLVNRMALAGCGDAGDHWRQLAIDKRSLQYVITCHQTDFVVVASGPPLRSSRMVAQPELYRHGQQQRESRSAAAQC